MADLEWLGETVGYLIEVTNLEALEPTVVRDFAKILPGRGVPTQPDRLIHERGQSADGPEGTEYAERDRHDILNRAVARGVQIRDHVGRNRGGHEHHGRGRHGQPRRDSVQADRDRRPRR
jgi:hypothetical protein